MKRPKPRRARRAHLSCITSRISPCTASCICTAMTTKRKTKPRPWNGWNARSSPGSTFPIPMRRVMPADAMPDSDDPSSRKQSFDQRTNDTPRAAENGESLMTRLLRVLGLKSGTTRDELEEVLEEGAGDETGFSPEEQALLKNILGLRERRIEDVMLPRADVSAGQQDIPLGDLMKVFE